MALLRREEATYSLIDGHFAIDCACGGINKVYFRNHVQEGFEDFQGLYQTSNSTRMREVKHTFYINLEMIEPWLDWRHHESEGKKPLEIISITFFTNYFKGLFSLGFVMPPVQPRLNHF